MLEIVIIGAGGFGRELAQLLGDCVSPDEYRLKGFLGRATTTADAAGLAAPLLGDPQLYVPQRDDRLVLAIGEIEARRRTVESLASRGGQFLTIRHPTACVAASARIGQGAVLYPYSVVSHAAVLDDFVHLNYYASMGHDARAGRFCLLAPYATLNGGSVLEDEVYLSTHVTIAPQVRVGCRSKVSANSAVMKDVPPGRFVFGVPGRQMPRLDGQSG